jgi:hypothetical protein
MMATGAWDCITQQMNTANSCEWCGKYQLPEVLCNAWHAFLYKDVSGEGAVQVQQHLEGPIGMALYEWQDGQIGMACVHGGNMLSQGFISDDAPYVHWTLLLQCIVKALPFKQTPCHRS